MYPLLLLLGIWLQSTPFTGTSTLIIPILQLKSTSFVGGGGLVAKSCPTLETPWTVARQAPLSVGFSRQEYWSGLPFPFCNWRTQALDRLFHPHMATRPRTDRALWFFCFDFYLTHSSSPSLLYPSTPICTWWHSWDCPLSISCATHERMGHFLLMSMPECLRQWHQYQWSK